MGEYNNDALADGKRVLESCGKHFLHGAHENKRSRCFPHGINDGGGGIGVQDHGGTEGDNLPDARVLDDHFRLRFRGPIQGDDGIGR